jgi:hypothetical protein
MYEKHRSWYSWVLGSLVGAVYTFGFILMCPQVKGAGGRGLRLGWLGRRRGRVEKNEMGREWERGRSCGRGRESG